MLIKHSRDIPEQISSLKGTKNCTLRWLINEKDGAAHYAMRLFELKPGGSIPVHFHEDTEHEIYIVAGTAILDTGKEQVSVVKGDAIFIKPGDKHSFTNSSDSIFQFICVIPI